MAENTNEQVKREPKKNKDGFIPGQIVDESSHWQVLNKRKAKKTEDKKA
jgi:hypothetical protein